MKFELNTKRKSAIHIHFYFKTENLSTEVAKTISKLSSFSTLKGVKGEKLFFNEPSGQEHLVYCLGEQKTLTEELFRRELSQVYKLCAKTYPDASIDLKTPAQVLSLEACVYLVMESFGLTSYQFNTHFKRSLAEKNQTALKLVSLLTPKPLKNWKALEERAKHTVSSIHFCRDLVNEPPNLLNSEVFAKSIVADARKNLPKGQISVKVLGKKDLTREKMGLFLAVNAGSRYEPQLVHLTYTPRKKTSKHIALVGKGLTFDTGGYSLKGPEFMVNMKFDMAGAATVYAAFRSAVLQGCQHKLTCILGMTDNVVSNTATFPDAVCVSRKGISVEIVNTDAEGRLVLADCLDYACDLKPTTIIDAATLTGAILVALGSETCGVFTNNQPLVKKLLNCAESAGEKMWPMPIHEEFFKEIKSPIADLKNMGANRFGGSGKAAAFLQEFIGKDIAWAHLDIAGIGDSQSYLPYCPAKGASGLMVRTLTEYLLQA